LKITERHRAVSDGELQEMLVAAIAKYKAMSPEEKATHDRAQAISFVYGNLKLSGIDVTVEQVAAEYDSRHEAKVFL
jgi:hypothetical protein